MMLYRVQEIKLSFVHSKRRRFQIRTPADVAKVFKNLCKEVRESLYAVYLNSANEVIGIERVFTGTIRSSPAESAEIVRSALIIGAQALIIIHNHPSGSIMRSAADHAITRTIAQTAKLFKIQLLDHLIIGANGAYYSFSDSRMLPTDEAIPLKAAGKKQRITVTKRGVPYVKGNGCSLQARS